MVVLKAHFDGKVFVPDEPVTLGINQPVRLIVETSDGRTDTPFARRVVDLSWLRGTGHGSGVNPHPRYTHNDQLWEKD